MKRRLSFLAVAVLSWVGFGRPAAAPGEVPSRSGAEGSSWDDSAAFAGGCPKGHTCILGVRG